MLLEVNRLRHLIIGRPPTNLAKSALWKTLAHFKVAILVEAESLEAFDRACDGLSCEVIPYDSSQTYGLQSNIRIALERLGAEPFNSAYVTFHAGDELPDAVNTHIGTIQAGGKIGEVMADIYMRTFPDGLPEACDPRALLGLGYSGESIACVGDGCLDSHGGQIISQPRFFISKNYVRNPEQLNDVRVFALGRYFASEDTRHLKHQYTRRLLKIKECDPAGKIVMSALGGALHLMVSQDATLNIITRVPPKPGKPRDHLEWILGLACDKADTKFGGHPPLRNRVELGLLVCKDVYRSQKEAGSFLARAANVSGHFRCTRNLNGEHVLLLDDILTSGSTAAECARTLLGAGAGKVTVIVLAINQNILKEIPLGPKCPSNKCDGTLQPRLASIDPFKMFWGCTEYFKGACKGTLPWAKGLTQSNQLNTRDDLPLENDIEF